MVFVENETYMEKIKSLFTFPLATPLRAVFCSIGLTSYLVVSLNSTLFYRGGGGSNNQSYVLLFAFFLLAAFSGFAVSIYARDRLDHLLISSRVASGIGICLLPISYFFIRGYIYQSGALPLLNALAVLIYATGLVSATCVWGCTLYQFRQKESLLTVVVFFVL